MIAALVPAAGESRRMGRPKLLLSVEGVAVIARVVKALVAGGAHPVLVVSPPIDASGGREVETEAVRAGARVVVPEAQPPDMRTSVMIGLRRLESDPAPITAVLLAPADSPGLTASLVARVIRRSEAEPGAIVVPTFEGVRGHPVALPWPIARAVFDLPEDAGVNTLIRQNSDRVVELSVDDPGAIDDLDTPEDYRRWEHDG